jgi:hypothetical protein
MNCVFYEYKLRKKIPCVLIPGKIYVENNSTKRITKAHVYFDKSKSEEYGVTYEEFIRYSTEFVDIYFLYPANTQSEINYLNTVIPESYTNNYDELNRFEAIITMITNTENDISREMFYILSDLVSYELLFNYCEYSERIFMMSLSTEKLVHQPNVVLIPQMVRMTKRIFSKYSNNIDNIDTYYDLDNYNNYYEYSNILPITINVDNLKHNVNFIII